jgi:hypothetical protein
MKKISTYYQYKRIHKGTRISPDGNTLNQIGNVIIDVVEDVRTMRGLISDSDHFLVKTMIKQKLIRTQTKIAKQAKWDQNNLQDPAKLKQFRSCLHKKLKRKEQSTEEEWTLLKRQQLNQPMK